MITTINISYWVCPSK